MSISIDQNRRLDCVLQYCKDLPYQRVANIAFPFLSLNAKTAIFASVGAGVCQSYERIPRIANAIKNREWKACGKESLPLGLMVSSIAFSVLAPKIYGIISNGLCMTYRVGQLSAHLWKHEWKKSGQVSLQITHQVIHIASLYYGTPAWIIVSLVSQASLELYQAIDFASTQRKPEALASIVMVMIRLYAVRKMTSVGRSLTQIEWNDIYSKIEEERKDQKIDQDISSILMNRGISRYIQDIDFAKTPNLSNLLFKNLHFQTCNFSSVRFDKSQFQNITANHCNFYNVQWINCELNRVFFDNCQIYGAILFSSHSNVLSMTDCDLTLFHFNDSTVSNLTITRGKLLETNFLHARIFRGKLIDCDLTDALLLDAKKSFEIRGGITHHITRPVIALGWHFREPGRYTRLIGRALSDNNLILLRYENEEPSGIDGNRLDKEVQTSLSQILYPLLLSKPHQMLGYANKSSEIYKIQEKAASILKHCQALAIPGGSDIEGGFYRNAQDNDSQQISGTSRSMLDFAVLALAETIKIPVMGTCRGAQLINVWRGGTLRNVDTQSWFHPVTFTESTYIKEIQETVGDALIVHAHHHQAVDELGQGLHPVLKYDDISKFLISEDGALVACQIHPEFYMAKPSPSDFESGITGKFFNPKTWDDFVEINRRIYQYFAKKVPAHSEKMMEMTMEQEEQQSLLSKISQLSTLIAERVTYSVYWIFA